MHVSTIRAIRAIRTTTILTGLLAALAAFAPAARAADPICAFSADRECGARASQCHRDVTASQEPKAVATAEHAACDAKATACRERMRMPAAQCADLKSNLDQILIETQKRPLP